jgi:hypothetical protein
LNHLVVYYDNLFHTRHCAWGLENKNECSASEEFTVLKTCRHAQQQFYCREIRTNRDTAQGISL